uniref:Uncharacterized protein n=1 Tax=Arundo donax TaxID=35708 RepID=A0A0A9FQ67_ARUDO
MYAPASKPPATAASGASVIASFSAASTTPMAMEPAAKARSSWSSGDLPETTSVASAPAPLLLSADTVVEADSRWVEDRYRRSATVASTTPMAAAVVGCGKRTGNGIELTVSSLLHFLRHFDFFSTLLYKWWAVAFLRFFLSESASE